MNKGWLPFLIRPYNYKKKKIPDFFEKFFVMVSILGSGGEENFLTEKVVGGFGGREKERKNTRTHKT